MLALVMLAVLTAALSLALSVSVRAQSSAGAHAEMEGTVRVVFDALTRDLQAAYVSADTSGYAFIAGQTGGSAPAPRASAHGASNDSSQQQTSPPPHGLLTLLTLSQRLPSDAARPDGAAMPSAGPRSEAVMVTYDLDRNTGELRRFTRLPVALADAGPTGAASEVLAQRIVDLRLRFWDNDAQTWQTEWSDTEKSQQLAQQQPQSGGASQGSGQSSNTQPGNGQSGQASGGGASPSVSPGSDEPSPSPLPAAVEVTLVLRDSQGAPRTFTTIIPVVEAAEIPSQSSQATTPPANGTGQPAGNGTGQPTGTGGGQSSGTNQ